jgi:hypothetical protein
VKGQRGRRLVYKINISFVSLQDFWQVGGMASMTSGNDVSTSQLQRSNWLIGNIIQGSPHNPSLWVSRLGLCRKQH